MRIAKQDSKRGVCALEVFPRLPVVFGEGLFLVNLCITVVRFRVGTLYLPFVELKIEAKLLLLAQRGLILFGPGNPPMQGLGTRHPSKPWPEFCSLLLSPSSFLRAPGAVGRSAGMCACSFCDFARVSE